MKQSADQKLHSRRRVLLAALVTAGAVYAAPALLGLNVAQAYSRYTYPTRYTRPSRYTRPTRYTYPSHPYGHWNGGYRGNYHGGGYRHPGGQGGWQPR